MATGYAAGTERDAPGLQIQNILHQELNAILVRRSLGTDTVTFMETSTATFAANINTINVEATRFADLTIDELDQFVTLARRTAHGTAEDMNAAATMARLAPTSNNTVSLYSSAARASRQALAVVRAAEHELGQRNGHTGVNVWAGTGF